MNPISVFKDVARRVAVEDHLQGVKAQAEADAQATAQQTAARFAAARNLEAQQTDAAFDRDDRMALQESQNQAAFSRSKLTTDAADARARASAFATGTNTHFDNATRLKDADSARAYLSSPAVGRADLLPSVESFFAEKATATKKTGWDHRVSAAKTMAEFRALRSRPEFQEFGNTPEFAAAEAGAQEADRRYGVVEGRRNAAQKRLTDAADLKVTKGKTPALSAAQERILSEKIFNAKLALLNADDDEEKALRQEYLTKLEDIKARSKPAGSTDPAILAELRAMMAPAKK